MRQNKPISIVVLLLAIAIFSTVILSTNVYASVSVDVGNYSVSNPKILLNYSEYVVLQSSILVDSTHPDPYTLCQVPVKTDYTKNFELYTKIGATEGTCTDGTVKLLEPGKYSLTLQAINRDGNATIDTVEFTIVGLDIQFISPAHGIANKTPYDVKFFTDSDAICKYAFTANENYASMLPTVEADMYMKTHRVLGLTYVDSDFYVICKEKSGRMTAKTMRIGFDNTAPVFQEIAAIPQKIINPNEPYSSIIVKTDDKTVCSIVMCKDSPTYTEPVLFTNENGKKELATVLTDYNITHATTYYYNESPCSKSVGDLRPYAIYHNITCKNLAGYSSSRGITVDLNFSEYSYINVLEPSALVNRSTFTVVVEPADFISKTCTLDGKTMNPGTGANIFTLDKILPPNPKKVYDVTLNISCENDIKHAERKYTITIDVLAPPAPIITGGDSICSGYIPVKFSVPDGSTVATYTYTVTDGLGFLLQNTTSKNTFELQMPNSAPTHLKWTVYATDEAGNQGPANETEVSLNEGDDETCGLPPFITFRSPRLGFSEIAPYDLVLETVEPSECRYSLDKQTSWEQMTKFISSEQNMAHTKTKLTQESAVMFVQCLEKNVDKVHYKTINIGVDKTAPRISVKISPNTIVEDPRYASVEVITDDFTYCRHTSDAGLQFTTLPDDQQRAYTKSHYTVLDYRSAPNEPQEHEFDITCTNLVGEETTVIALVATDISPAINMELLSPSGFSASVNNELIVNTDQEATCYWHSAGDAVTKALTENNGNYTASLGKLEEGTNFFAVWCEADGESSVIAFSVTVDNSLPGLKNLSGPSPVCVDKIAQYSYEVIGLDTTPTISYFLEAENGAGVSFEQNTTDAVLSVPLTGILSGNYTLNAIAINHANVRGSKASIPIVVLDSNNEICMQAEGHCTDKVKNPGEQGIDCGGTCPNACISCFDKFGCPIDMMCVAGVCVKQNSCTTHDDCLATERCENNICVDASCDANAECLSPTICIQGMCNDAPSCESDDNCPIPYSCVQKVCVLPICGNEKKDAEELAVDCGGSCTSCVACKTKDDCKSAQNCTSGFCVSPSCSTTNDCDENHVCQNNECIPVFVCTTDDSCQAGTCMSGVCKSKSCSTFKDCSGGQDCQDNQCVKGTKCTGDETCINGKNCVAGTCVDGCENDLQCAKSGKVCKSNVCVEVDIPKPECVKDDDCTGEGEICSVDQKCIMAPKSNLISYILLVVGLLIMGGAGYFLYQQDVEKKRIAAENASMQAARAQPRKVMIAPQMAGQRTGQQSQQGVPGSQNSQTAQQNRQGTNGQSPNSQGLGLNIGSSQKIPAEKSTNETKRNSFFNAFDNGVEGKVSTIKDKTGSTSFDSSIDSPEAIAKQNEGFIDLSDINKKSSKKKDEQKDDKKDNNQTEPDKKDSSKKSSKESKSNNSQDDPFSDLDKIGKK